MLPITGDTFEIREQLKEMGCRWSAEHHCWMAPDETVRAQGQALADEEPRRKWAAFADTLTWAHGHFTGTVWEAGLRACSLGIPEREAVELVRARCIAGGRAPEPGWVERNVGRAYQVAEPPAAKVAPLAGGPSHFVPPPKVEVKEKPKYEKTKLAQFAERWRDVVDVAWLADRSGTDPLTASTDDFLRSLYQPGEHVVVLDVFKSQGQWLWSHEAGFAPSVIDYPKWDGNDPHHEAAPPLKAGRAFDRRGPEGIWYLTNPVSGAWLPTGEQDNYQRPKWSRRSEPEITAWRYFTLESDIKGITREWLGAMVQLPMPIAAIYTSGGKSVHVLVRVDARSKVELDHWRETALRTITVIGGDPANMTSVRLSRLPGCWRLNDKDGKPFPRPAEQRLLFLDPEPCSRPICQREPLRDTLGPWERLAQSLIHQAPEERESEQVDVAVAGLRRFKSGRSRALIEALGVRA